MKKLLLNVLAVATAITSFGFAKNFANTKKKEAHIAYKNDVLEEQCRKGVVFPGNPGPGGGGSEETGGTGEPVPVYNENDDYTDNWWRAEELWEEAIINGTLTNYWNKGDEDWFRFTIHRKCNYFFFFSAEQADFKFDVYKFEFTPGEHVANKYNTGYNDYVELEPGTYYLKFSFTDRYNYSTSRAYSFKMYRNYYWREYDLKNVPENKKLVLWEADIVPDNIAHLRNNKALMCEGSYLDFNSDQMETYRPAQGYIDPVYFESNTYMPRLSTNYYYDSIIYVWDHEDLCFLAAMFESLELILNNYHRKDRLKEIQFRFQQATPELIEAGVEFVLSIVAFFVGDTAGKVLGVIGVASSFISICKILVDVLSFKQDYDPVDYIRLGSHITELKWNAMSARDDSKYVLKIPKYAHVVREEPTWTTEAKYYWQSGYSVHEANRTNYYRVDKSSVLSTVQSFVDEKYSTDPMEYSGHFRTFDNLTDLMNRTGYSISVDLSNTPVYNSNDDFFVFITEETIANYQNTENTSNENQGNGEQTTPPEPEPDPVPVMNGLTVYTDADFIGNSAVVKVDFEDPYNEMSDFKVTFSDENNLSKIFDLEKTNEQQTLYGGKEFDFTTGKEVTYTFSYKMNGHYIVADYGTIVFQDRLIVQDHLHDLLEDEFPHFGGGIEHPYIPPYIGGSEPWIGGGGIPGIGGGSGPKIGGGGIGGGGFGGGL